MEKQQVLYIHGGQAFSDYEKFLEYLQTVPIEYPLEERSSVWSHSLRTDLGEAFEVYTPLMPNKQNAKYAEWKIWFERHLEFLHEGAILIGWSQGGYFLAKYLSENIVPIRIRALILIAAPSGPDDFGGEDGGDFAFNLERLPHLRAQVDELVLFHSTDDPIVPFTHAETYKESLPDAELVICEGLGHFILPLFPELLEKVREIAGR